MDDNLLDSLISEDQIVDRAIKINGVVVGIVASNKDDQGLGRVKVTFPWMSEENESEWARVATLMSGPERGSFFLPEEGDEVLVAFEHGDINRPFVIGCLWNDEDKPPQGNEDEENNIRMIKSRSGHQFIFDDKDGKEKIEILTMGDNKIILDDGEEKISIIDKNSNGFEINIASDEITISSKKKLILKASTIEIKADENMNLEANGNMTIKASGNTTIEGAIVNIN